jgi:hypothetical protein
MAGALSNLSCGKRERAWRAVLMRGIDLFAPAVLGILFFVLLTPVGLVLRLAGRDRLRLRFQPLAPSYWVPRASHGGPQRSTGKQF